MISALNHSDSRTFLGHRIQVRPCVGMDRSENEGYEYAWLAVWFSPMSRRFGTVLLSLDAIGLAAYATYGAAKALAYGAALLPAFGLGVLTACAGGIIRDLLAHDRSILLRPELYVTVAAISSALVVVAAAAGLPIWMSAIGSTAAGFGLRAAAITWRWGLPVYSPDKKT